MPLKNQALTITYTAWDTVANAPKTGDVANHTIRGIGDGTEYTPAASPAEVDATNAKGEYRIALAAGEMNYNFVTVAGVSSTTGVVIIPVKIATERGVLPTVAPNASGGLPTVGTGAGQINPDGFGKVHAADVGGLAPPSNWNLMALDTSGRVQVQSGTGTGQLNLSSGLVALATDPFTSTTTYLSTQLGGMIQAINTIAGHLTFDGSNNVLSKVNAYGTGFDPAAQVLGGAVPGSYGSTTLGYKVGTYLDATITSRNSGNVTVGGYAAGQAPDYLTWNALTATYNGTNTFGHYVQGITGGGGGTDPWSTVLPGSYSTNTAGYLVGTYLNAAITSRMAAGDVTVGAYATGKDPASSVWGATLSDFSFGTGTFGPFVQSLPTSDSLDPWAVTLPGAYGTGTAGSILATNLNATITSRQASGNVTVGGYETGQDPASSTWGAATGSFTATGSFGARMNALIDPWATDISTGYTGTQAGHQLYNLIPALLATSIPGSPGAGTVGEAFQKADVNLDATITSRASGTVTVGGYSIGMDPASQLFNATVPSSPSPLSGGDALHRVLVDLDATISSRLGSGDVTVGGYATGMDPESQVWDAAVSGHSSSGSFGADVAGITGGGGGTGGDPLATSLPGSYASGTAGYMLYHNYLQGQKLTFDGSNNIIAKVNAYGNDLSPDYLTWNAGLSSYNSTNTFGHFVQGIAAGADPLATTLPGAYLNSQAGGMLYQMAGRLDQNVSGVPAAILGAAVEGSITWQQWMHAVGAMAGGEVDSLGGNQFVIRALGNPGLARITGTSSPDYTTRTINALNL